MIGFTHSRATPAEADRQTLALPGRSPAFLVDCQRRLALWVTL
jgi:hypothetical protein